MSNHSIPELDRNGLRRFGLTTGVIVVALFGIILPILLLDYWPIWPWFVAIPLWVLAAIRPIWLRPIYHGWMRFGLVANKIMTPIVLGIVFFSLISVVAIVRRLFGSDPMRRRFESDAESYRITSEKVSNARLEKPF